MDVCHTVFKGPAECMCRAHSVNVQNLIVFPVKIRFKKKMYVLLGCDLFLSFLSNLLMLNYDVFCCMNIIKQPLLNRNLLYTEYCTVHMDIRGRCCVVSL